VSREGSSAGTGHQALRTGRRSVPSAAWRDVTSMTSNRSKDKDVRARVRGGDVERGCGIEKPAFRERGFRGLFQRN
jgi:hypothetical protein